MQHHFIQQTDRDELLILFNGWGMDHHLLQHLDPAGLSVLAFSDYTEMTTDSASATELDIESICAGYDRVHLVAWSLGVWAAARFFADRPIRIESATAINGTLSPIDSRGGIPPEVFRKTLDGWDESSRTMFERRMCGPRPVFKQFTANHPERDITSQKTELAALQTAIELNHPIRTDLYDTAIIGLGDRIFPPKSQENAWQSVGLTPVMIDAAHYMFDQLTGWRELIQIGKVG